MLITMEEHNRLVAIKALAEGFLTVEQVSNEIQRSPRQVYRLLKRFREEKEPGLIHRSKGRPSPRRTPEQIKEKILSLVNGPLKDINDTHLREILQERHQLSIGRETLRSLLRHAGIGPKRKRRHPRYRQRRERKAALGAMLQLDASLHPWLEERGPKLTLVAAIDDATSKVWARFEQSETCWAYLELTRQIALSAGIPISYYSDRHTIFHSPRQPTIVEQLKNLPPLTQFGRAASELGITIIKAFSPQAKGRIEKLFQTLQDRLVVELRLAGASNIQQANQVLEKFLPRFNRRFAVPPKQQTSLFRKAPAPQVLDRILCLKDTRTVAKDHTISFEGLVLQIPPSKKFYSLAGRKVQVLQLRDGSIEIVHRDTTVARFSPQSVTRLIDTHLVQKSNLKRSA